jgi:membrane associated rhomboid family serine protease
MHWYGSREATIEENRAAVEIEWRERQQRQAAQRQPAVAGQVAPPAPAPAAKKAEPVKPTTADVEQWLMDEEELPPKDVGFRWYQLITHALLHADIMHLAGNLLFLIVFGLRVNELIGNIAAAIVYPILAIGSALIESMVHASEPLGAGLGASGAIMGLAGMYFIFFPTQKVHMAIWFRGGMLTGWRCFYKVWTMGGFWLLLLWIGFNDILPTLIGSADGDGVAHWAHLGGFMLGMAIAVGLLLARVTNARGGDLLSVTLGKRAWALVGKPTSRKDPAPTPRAVSLNYGG